MKNVFKLLLATIVIAAPLLSVASPASAGGHRGYGRGHWRGFAGCAALDCGCPRPRGGFVGRFGAYPRSYGRGAGFHGGGYGDDGYRGDEQFEGGKGDLDDDQYGRDRDDDQYGRDRGDDQGYRGRRSRGDRYQGDDQEDGYRGRGRP